MDSPDILLAVTSRIPNIVARADLQATAQTIRRETWYVIKDPLGLKYVRLRDDEYAVFRMLDGQHSLADIQSEFERRFHPRRVSFRDLQRLFALFHRHGLVLADSPGQGSTLLRRRRHGARWQWLASWSSVLAIRLPGIDPEPLLGWLSPLAGWFFSRWAVVGGCGFALAALLLVTTHLDEFSRQLPAFQQLASGENLLWLAASMAAVKVLHEFGHALACKRFGGECHEIGVMFLMFVPCLYCDTSDAWQLPNKWWRAAVGAAGIYVEIVIAASCTFLWWWTRPGLIHDLCLNAILVCSLSTLIVNGNPLLRYDGYYVLSDLWEIPNLWQRSREALVEFVTTACLGLPKSRPSHFVPASWGFLSYSLASVAYRAVMVVTVLRLLVEIFEPHGLASVGRGIMVFSLAGMAVVPLVQGYRFVSVPGRFREVKFSRVAATLLLAAAVAWGLAAIPVPHHLIALSTLEPRDAVRVYVQVPGKLQQVAVSFGQRVTQGQTLATLANTELELEVARLTGERARAALQLRNLQRRQGQASVAASQIPQATMVLADLSEQLARRESDWARLSLVAPQAGVVLPPPEVVPESDEHNLPTWSGTPLEPINRSAYLETGMLVCLIGEPRQMSAELVVDQEAIEFLRPRQVVRLQFNELPMDTLRGRIDRISRNDIALAPRTPADDIGAGRSATDPRRDGRTSSVAYLVSVVLEGIPPRVPLRPGYRGQARICVDSQPLAQRLWRFLTKTFEF